MPVKYIGRTTDFKGKTLWEILGNLKNFGVGRMIIRNRFQRYPEACYMRILKVATMPAPQEFDQDRKIVALVERVFRGSKYPIPLQLCRSTYKADYELVPKDKEYLYSNNTKIPAEKTLPATTDFPPLLEQIIIRQMKAKGVEVSEKPQLPLCYNFNGTSIKTYRLAKEDETPTVKLNFSVDESNSLYPKPEEIASS